MFDLNQVKHTDIILRALRKTIGMTPSRYRDADKVFLDGDSDSHGD